MSTLSPYGAPTAFPALAMHSMMALHTDTIRASHDRCQGFGLAHADTLDFSAQALADFKVSQERCARLQAQALPVMELLLDQVAGTSNIVCLADDKGTILMSTGRGTSVEFAERVALRPGVSWSESSKGTNAVGTALIEETDIFVHANEHFMQANHVLTCSASPIMDHSGGLLGVLDVTGDQPSFHPHTMALVKVAARTIESYLFQDNFSRHLRLHFHTQPELIGTLVEGVIALSNDGKILGINRAGLHLLEASSAAVRMQGLRSVFGMGFGEIMDQMRSASTAPFAMQMPTGRVLFARAQVTHASFGPLYSTHSAPSVVAVATATATATAPKTKAASVPALADLALGDAQMRSVVDKVRRVMDRDVPLLILGGTGTGKEYLAKAIHHASLRKNHAFVAVNCASVPENLIESELFGYEEGAFTGAKRKGAVGKLLQADGGTLLLDEIGDMPLAMQARLLRVLQERKVVPLGGSKSHDIDVNLVCATHRNLREMIAEGSFREDLYYRINGLAVRLPRLSERTDLRTLCQQMLTQLSPHHALTLGESLADDFAQYDWPGNLRELHNVLRTATVLAGSDRQITRVHLSDDFLADLAIARARAPASAAAVLVGSSQARFEAQQLDEIRDAVKAQHGNVTLAAKALNVSRNTIYRKLKAAGISL